MRGLARRETRGWVGGIKQERTATGWMEGSGKSSYKLDTCAEYLCRVLVIGCGWLRTHDAK
jgi:hypothetical protein